MDGRRRITLYDQMTATNTTSLADLILHDNVTLTEQKTDSSPATATAADGRYQLTQNRTLIDILREDSRHLTNNNNNNNNNGDDNNNNNNNNATATDRKSWKASFNFIDKLMLKLTLTSSDSTEIGSSNNNNNDSNRNNLSESQTRLDSDELTQRDTSQQQQQQQNDVVVAVEPEIVAVAGPVGVSLMDLLEETDVETGFEVSSYRMSDADYDDVNEEFEGEGTVVEHSCCVCMVRHKGAAFIPCGHTFCRTCSREVWVNRGNCPLCNNLILEILDIF